MQNPYKSDNLYPTTKESVNRSEVNNLEFKIKCAICSMYIAHAWFFIQLLVEVQQLHHLYRY